MNAQYDPIAQTADFLKDFADDPPPQTAVARPGNDPAPHTGRVVQAYAPAPPPAVRHTPDEVMAYAAADFNRLAQELLLPEQRAELVRHAAANMPAFHEQPQPGMIEVIVPGTGRTLYAWPVQPAVHTPPAIEARAPIVDKKAVNVSLVSLSVSGAAWMAAAAVRLWVDAAVAFMQALAAIGTFALFAAFIFGLISIAKKKAGAPQIHLDQRVHNEVHTKSLIGARTNVDGSAHMHTHT